MRIPYVLAFGTLRFTCMLSSSCISYESLKEILRTKAVLSRLHLRHGHILTLVTRGRVHGNVGYVFRPLGPDSQSSKVATCIRLQTALWEAYLIARLHALDSR